MATLITVLLPGIAAAAAQEATPPEPIPVLGIDLYRTDAFDAAWLNEAVGEDLRALLGGRLPDEEVQATVERIRTTIRSRGDFAYVQPSAIQYFEEGGAVMYITLDVVDAADAAERIPFREAPTGQVEGAEELIAAWREYETEVMALLSSGTASPPGQDACPAYHCLPLAFAQPELEPYQAEFDVGASEQQAVLANILAGDADEEDRGAAAYLLAHTEDPQWIADRMMEAVLDPSSLVRNNAIRVLAHMSNEGVAMTVPLEPVLQAIDFPATTDRNKALALLTGIVEHSDEHDARVADQAGQRLVELLRLQQPNNHDFAWRVLKAISGQDLGERDYEAWAAWLAAR